MVPVLLLKHRKAQSFLLRFLSDNNEMDNVDLGELNYRFEPAGQLLIGRGGMQAKGEDQGKGKRKHQVEGPEAGFLSWGSKKARKAKKDTASHKGATKWKTFEGADSLLRTPAKQVL
jgi:hypothetical protein